MIIKKIENMSENTKLTFSPDLVQATTLKSIEEICIKMSPWMLCVTINVPVKHNSAADIQLQPN